MKFLVIETKANCSYHDENGEVIPASKIHTDAVQKIIDENEWDAETDRIVCSGQYEQCRYTVYFTHLFFKPATHH